MPAARGNRFVGRQAELDVLRAELDVAMHGEGRLLLLVGEPGIGKTRLATALAAEARERGAAVVWGRCHEQGGAPAYWPWVQVLDAYASQHCVDEAHGLAALVAALRAGAGLADARAVPERARFELFYRVVTVLTSLARAQPLLIIVDDLHWADIGSLLLLEFVARELGTLPLLVLGTTRDAESAPRTDTSAPLATAVRLGRSVPLAGLIVSEVRDLLADRLGRVPAEDLVAEVVGLTNGNPFFVIEMLHLLAAGRIAARALPPGVEALLRQRLDPLPASSRRLLEIAAVVGREFDLAPLTAALREPSEVVLDALAPALAAGIVREVPEALLRYGFAHALMREAVYTSLTPSTRIGLHAVVGAALEAAGSRDHVERSALAHHFFEAAQGGDPSKAIRYACEAGEQALDVLAFEESVRHFERGLAASAVGTDDATRVRLLAGLAEAVHGAGDPARAETVFATAVDVARRCGATAFAEAVLRCAGVRSEFGMTDVEMNSLLEEALAVLAPGPSALRARLLVRLAAGLSLEPGAEQRRHALADEAIAMARAIDDPATLAFVLPRRLIALLGPDTLEQRVATTSEMLATQTYSRHAELNALIFRVDDLAQQGDRTGLDHALAAFHQQAQASRQPFFLWMATTFRATMALLEGRFAEAEMLANEAFSVGQSVQARTAVLYFSEQFLMLRGWQARFAEIEPFIEMSVANTVVMPAWRCALADFYDVSGREAEARREFEALAVDGFAALPRDTMWLEGMYLLAGVCSRFRDAPRAALLYEQLQPYAGRIAVGWPLVVLVGIIDERLGMLATVLERYDVAEQHFAHALALAERMRGLPWQADIRHQWARLLYQRGGSGDREHARGLLDEAEAIARALGMTLLLEWIGEMGEARMQSEPAAPRTATFRRDGDVWSIVFEGRTTRVRDMLGLAHIARLLREPERDVHVLDLAAGPDVSAGERRVGDAGELLDAQARAAYEARIRDAREELAEAEQYNDRGRCERLVDEIEFLTAELARSLGLNRRSRRAGAPSERARVAVTRAIKYAIDRVGENDPALAEHLRLAVRTGTFCSYAPSTRDLVTWTL